ncbi:MAG: methyltransferase domain-containing protein [Synechococcales cyanobacterium M58_A2018_015]|nr:methyltransferase domain-containing protein [Synechococcales cyanobacterium M58_A2018_015]
MNSTFPSIADYKSTVVQHFGDAAQDYDRYAELQRQCAQQLLERIAAQSLHIPDGVILEIGCGTGFVTQALIQTFPHRYLEITDLSPQMIQACQSNLIIPSAQADRITFHVLDGEAIRQTEWRYALIVSGFVFQWFTNPIQSLHRLISCLQPGGWLCLSFPGKHSFPEWRAVCHRLNLPFTANPLPNPEQLQRQLPLDAMTRHLETVQFTISYTNAIEFFRSLKRIGADVSRSKMQLSPAQLKQLLRHWDDQQRLPNGNQDDQPKDDQPEAGAKPRITVTYDVVFWLMQRM